MTAYILLTLFVLVFVGVVIVDILKEKRHQDEVDNLTDRIDYIKDQNDYLNREIADVNLKFSESLDTREKNLNEYVIRIKKLELELEAKNNEIDRLNRRIAVIEMPVDISKIIEVKHEEKEA